MKLIPSRNSQLLTPEIQSVRRRFERWRRNKKHRSPIPEELWASAANLASGYGLAKTARSLRLNYYSLKERIKTGRQKGCRERNADPAFVELIPQPTAAISECTMELEDRSGARMRIHVKGATTPNLTDLSDRFWRMRR